MEKYFIFWVFLFTSIVSTAQITEAGGSLIYEDTLSLNPLNSWISIDTAGTGIWDISTPNKTFFNSDLSNSLALITDSSKAYPTNIEDYFTITLPWMDNYWPQGILSFFHKYDTDTLRDGGIIEITYDEGNSWINMINDHGHIQTNFIGLYTDTLFNGEFGFSGHSGDWQYVELYWWWVAVTKKDVASVADYPQIRFRFISDDKDNQKEGWMIDDIVFRAYSGLGSVGAYSTHRTMVYPNPARENVSFRIKNLSDSEISIFLYNNTGQLMKSLRTRSYNMDVSDLETGIYLYKIWKSNIPISTGKIIIDK